MSLIFVLLRGEWKIKEAHTLCLPQNQSDIFLRMYYCTKMYEEVTFFFCTPHPCAHKHANACVGLQGCDARRGGWEAQHARGGSGRRARGARDGVRIRIGDLFVLAFFRSTKVSFSPLCTCSWNKGPWVQPTRSAHVCSHLIPRGRIVNTQGFSHDFYA